MTIIIREGWFKSNEEIRNIFFFFCYNFVNKSKWLQPILKCFLKMSVVPWTTLHQRSVHPGNTYIFYSIISMNKDQLHYAYHIYIYIYNAIFFLEVRCPYCYKFLILLVSCPDSFIATHFILLLTVSTKTKPQTWQTHLLFNPEVFYYWLRSFHLSQSQSNRNALCHISIISGFFFFF